MGENLPRQTEVEELYKQANMDDLADILYTSGTTGDSKGVMLTYEQYYAAIKANDECVPVTDKDRVIDFLPFTHIFERAWSYLCLSEGARLLSTLTLMRYRKACERFILLVCVVCLDSGRKCILL